MITVNGIKTEPTRFPDGTTQAWHLPKEILGADRILIDWRFEREDEIMTVLQLINLSKRFFPTSGVTLKVPYFPYARQDKVVSNDTTFALHTFAQVLQAFKVYKIITWDVHNPALTKGLLPDLVNVEPMAAQLGLVKKLGIRTVIFPDAGASARYTGYYVQSGVMSTIYQKKRDQATGKILGIERTLKGRVAPEVDVRPGPVLIVDDICDGGATFLGIEQSMREEGIREFRDLHLFVTHGIFSKGRKILEDAGIKLWTTNSLPANVDGIDLDMIGPCW